MLDKTLANVGEEVFPFTYTACRCQITIITSSDSLPSLPENSQTPSVAISSPTTPQDSLPPKAKKPKVLELPSCPTLLPPGLSLDKVNAAVKSLVAPGSATNTLTPSVITSHSLVSGPGPSAPSFHDSHLCYFQAVRSW